MVQDVSYETSQRASVDELLQKGIELYGLNKTADAIHCWQEALALAPEDQRAIDYLESAGVKPAPPPQRGRVITLHPGREPRPPQSSLPLIGLDDLDAVAVDRDELVRLLREKRYEEALLFLYKERDRVPHDTSLTRGIHALKDHLTTRYARELGSLDLAPQVVARDEELRRLAPEQREVVRLIDGVATYGDILVSSRLGRFETYRTLALMLKRGAIAVPEPLPSYPAPPPATAGKPSAALADPEIEQAPPTPRAGTVPPRPVAMRATPKPPAEPVATATPASTPVPPSASRSAPPPASPRAPADPYLELFERATAAYLRRDYDEALHLFEECVARRPGDRRAEHNLRRLRERKGSS